MRKITALIVSSVIAAPALTAGAVYSQGLRSQAKEMESSILKQRKARETASIAHKYLYKLCRESYESGRYGEARNYAKKILAMDPTAVEAQNWLLRIETAEAILEGVALPQARPQTFWEEAVIEEEAAVLPEEETLEAAAQEEEEILEEPRPMEEVTVVEKPREGKPAVKGKAAGEKTTRIEEDLEKEIADMEKVLEKEIAEIKEILERRLGKEKKEIEEVEVEIGEFVKEEDAPQEKEAAPVRPRSMKLERKEALKYHYNLAIVYEEKEQYDEAEIEYKKALEAVPGDPDTHYNLGILYDDRFRDRASAVKHYRKYLELKPGAQDKEQVKTWIRWAQQQIAIGKF